MPKPTHFPIATMSALALSLVGCATDPQAISLGLSQMGTEESVDAGSLFAGLKHRRSYNITGLGAIDTLGMVSLDPDPPLLTWPRLSRSRLPDNLALRLSPDCTTVVSASYAPLGSENLDPAKVAASAKDSVIKARQALDSLQEAQFSQVRLLANQGLFQILIEAVKASESANADADAKAKDQTDPAALATAKANAEQKKRMREQLEAAMRTLPDGSALVKSATTNAERELANAKATVELLKANEEVSKAQILLKQAVDTPGVVISRWAMAKEKVSTFGIMNAADVKNSAQDQQDGYLILGNPRVDTLLVGDDFVVRACKADGAYCGTPDGNTTGGNNSKRSGIDSITKANQQYITTYQLLAQSWSWAEDRSLQRAHQLAVSVGDLIAALKSVTGATDILTALEKVKVDIQIASSLAMSGSNTGLMAAPSIKTRPFSFATDTDHNLSIRQEVMAQSGFGRIISMRTTLDNYVLGHNSRAVMPKTEVSHCSVGVHATHATISDLERRCQLLPDGSEAKTTCFSTLHQAKNSLQNWLN